MSTVGLREHDGCHYSFEGYNEMGEWISRLIERDFYGSTDTLDITPPNVQEAWYSTPERDEISIRFDSPVVWAADTLGASMEDYFFLDGDWGIVDSGYVDTDGYTVVLRLFIPSSASTITYLPNMTYHGSEEIYEGPWIRNPRGIGALSFFEFPLVERN